MANFHKVLLLVFCFMAVFAKSNGATCTALASGNWEDAATWSCGSMPTCGDSIIIPAAMTVTITTILDYYSVCIPAMKITVKGILFFQTGKKIRLPCNSKIYIFSGGAVVPGGGGRSSNLIDICGTNYWNASDGTMTGPDCLPPGDCSNTVLPVELLSFTATPLTESVSIAWKTASETNNSFFTVEKSKDALHFEILGTEPGAGNSTTLKSYSFNDSKPYTGISYYRLKQTDFNGKFSYSAVVAIHYHNNTLSFYPNPSTGTVYMNTSSELQGETAMLKILDSRGAVAHSRYFEISSPFGQKVIETGMLNAGIYLILISAAGEEYKERLVIR